MMFYKEVNFKETSIGKIPKDWEVVRFSDVVNTLPGFAFSSKFFSKEKGIPLIRIRDLGKDSTETFYYGPYEEEYLVEKGDILVSMDGEFNVCLWKGSSGLLNQRVMKIWPKCKEKLDALYLYYASQKPLKSFEYRIAATTVKHLLTEHFRLIKIPLPTEIKEQQKIAEVLSTIDEAIQKTNEIIAKTERLKKGLMQELLTKGIGHKEFKDTEIGRIPKDWEVEKLGNKEFAEIIMGQSPPSSTYNREGKGLPFIQGKMEFGDIYPSAILYCSQPIKIAEPNDILISVRAPVGDVNVARYRICIGRGLAAIRFNSNRANYWFYFYYFQKIKNFLENLGKGSTFKAITKEDLENLKVPYPSFFEQQKIAEILFTIDKKLEIERNEKAKLERIKRGLMDLLLTGKIRVKVN
jgi:type I restriction enzyme S subunit